MNKKSNSNKVKTIFVAIGLFVAMLSVQNKSILGSSLSETTSISKKLSEVAYGKYRSAFVGLLSKSVFNNFRE